ncbi:hypothetical protein [Acinetobacter seifertii]|uniref:hypothetical protein n=1 Tax=Acinetobacter seifertii TaxID=1530123 RepID=UPI003EE37B9B
MSTYKKVATIIGATTGSIVSYYIGGLLASLFLPGLATMALFIVVNMLVAILLSLLIDWLVDFVVFRYYLNKNKVLIYV